MFSPYKAYWTNISCPSRLQHRGRKLLRQWGCTCFSSANEEAGMVVAAVIAAADADGDVVKTD